MNGFLIRKLPFIIFTFAYTFTTRATEFYHPNNDTINVKGLMNTSRKFIKQFSVLMRDTTLSGNRFDYIYHMNEKKDNDKYSKNFTLPPYLIDSILSLKCDSILRYGKSRVDFYNYSKNNYLKTIPDLNNYIRLYIGYIDRENNLYVVIQFVTFKEFKKMSPVLSYQLFLIIGQKNLRFAKIQFSPGNY